ncbi:MAG TPA: VOC family protein [Waterburya sp.]
MSDLGFTHVALPVSNMEASLAFYAKYAQMQVVHRRSDRTTQVDVVWLSDLTRPFVIVLIEVPQVNHPLLPIAHLGVACETREEVERLCHEAQLEGILQQGPKDDGYPVGYWAFITDPDGHTLEISYGQEVTFTVKQANNHKSKELQP